MSRIIDNAGSAPTWITDLEVTKPIEQLAVPLRKDLPYEHVRILVRFDRSPIGYVTFEAPSGTVIGADELAAGIWFSLHVELVSMSAEVGVPAPTGLTTDGLVAPEEPEDQSHPLISVVLCTRNRPEGAVRTIRDLLQLEYEPFEIVLVDNAPSDDATMHAIKENFSEDGRVRYVREDAAGLSNARNRGITEAHGSIIAFTDDDVRVDKWWLRGVLRGFRSTDNVGCVTGPVPSAQLDNEIQHYFDKRISWSSIVKPRRFGLKQHRDESVLYPFSPGVFGTGANFAFDSATIKSVGCFDQALGAGAPTGGGEDLDAFLKVLFANKLIVQEPSAIIWHVHRSSIDELNKQMFYYGVGLSAFIWKYLTNASTSVDVLRRIVPGIVKLGAISMRSNGQGSGTRLPHSVMLLEIAGMAYGPFAYARGKLRNKRASRAGKRFGFR